ncbi:MAG: flagellar basal-body rod protein FlgF [Lautropia sp.]|nr:flagellar basal-body rod protein FlgF [Lautropia sp.]
MDRMIYLSMTGAKALMERQDALTHNLANASTDGFRADLSLARAVPIRERGTATTRVFNVETTAGFDGKSGPIRETGNPLDIAIRDSGWLAVQAEDGTEAYTRDGGLVVDEQGNIRTRRGQTLLGDGGPISVPVGADIQIADDGSVMVRVGQQKPSQAGRIKLVDPDLKDMKKGDDGLMRMKDGSDVSASDSVRIVQGALEGSNVNVVESMVGMIEVSRQFEMQMKLLQSAESNDQRASQILALHS